MKKMAIIFLLAFALNVIWENLHSFLYDNYMGGEITQFVLVRASLFDALVITVILLPFIYSNRLRGKSWLIIPVGIIIAVFNEWYGLGTGRWMYNPLMPVIPVLKTGLTPTFQLGILAYLSYKIETRISEYHLSLYK